jgi:diguanylate cyclase (GGDEF)-like protein
MFDIDKFKNVNDTFGHATGDQVLIQTAQVVSAQLRATDIFGRIGGDEFVIIMPGTNAQQAFPMAERIRAEVARRTLETAQHPVTVTISMGITGISEDSNNDDVETLIRQADLALYAAKAAGRNATVIYQPEMG